jgi:type IV secretion system protein VirB10
MSTANMDPNSSPTAHGAGVKRVNNWPLYILAAGFGVFLLIIMLVAADRAAQQEEMKNTPADAKVGKAATSLAEDITRGYESGYIEPSEPIESPLEAEARLAEEARTEGQTLADQVGKKPSTEVPPAEMSPEVQAIVAQPAPNQQRGLPNKPEGSEDQKRLDDLRRRIEDARLRVFEQAVTAKTSVNTNSPSGGSRMGLQSAGNSGSGRNGQLAQLEEIQRQLESTSAQLASGDPMATYQARLAALQNSGIAGAGLSGGAPSSAGRTLAAARVGNADQSGAYSQFDGKADRWALDSQIDTPSTPYLLRAGYVIPGIMISGVNSDLPGQLQAQISQDVYDTATGQHLLIPQGSRLVGSYGSSISYGQERVMVAWQRIVFPDGKALDIGAMQGADGAGYAGFKDQVNHHFWRIFGSAMLMSVVVAGVEVSQDDGGAEFGQRRKAGDALSEAMGQQLGQATAQMLQKNLNIAPTIEIRPGYRFNIMVSKDLAFTKPYQSFDY